MIQALLDGAYSRVRLHPVRMAFSKRLDEVGRPSAGKLLHLAGVALRLAAARFRGATVLYYPPAGPGRAPLWRDVILLLLTRRLFPKVVYHFHIAGLADQYHAASRVRKWLIRRAYGRPDLAIYLSAHAAPDAAFMEPRAVRVIPNGLPDAEASGAGPAPRDPAAPPAILFLGALTPEKGVDTLIAAWSLLQKNGTPFRGVLAGEWRSARYGEAIRGRLAALGLAESVRLPGPLAGDAKWRAFAEADVFCFPSEADSFGLVVLEAMMMRLPVVASDWCGMKDLVAEGETGYRAPRGDAAAFAGRLEALLKDAALRRRFGEAGRARYLRDYTLDTWRGRMEQAFVDCAEGL